MYDAEQDIRGFYRSQIRAIEAEIHARGRRDPALHRLRADLKVIREKLKTLAQSHNAPMGALRDYGAW